MVCVLKIWRKRMTAVGVCRTSPATLGLLMTKGFVEHPLGLPWSTKFIREEVIGLKGY